MQTLGQNGFGTTGVTSFQNGQQYLDPWCIQGTLFIPVLPTYSNNLAGSASITGQYYVGQGCSFVGYTRDQDNSFFNLSGHTFNGQNFFERKLANQFGGYLQGQYWFTNQWFMNAAWGFNKNYGFNQRLYAAVNDQTKSWEEVDITLWYRPVEALKFGLNYAYERTDFLQNTTSCWASKRSHERGSIASPRIRRLHVLLS